MALSSSDFALDATDFPETGGWDPISAVADAVGGLADIAAGGPQKRERAARAERDAALAQQKAEEARLEIARLAAQAPAPTVATTAQAATGPSLGGLVDWLKKPGIAGVPNGVTVAVVAAACFALWRHFR